MSSIRSALEKLDRAVGYLDASVMQAQDEWHEAQENVIDVDFVARRLDKAIASVENLLQEEG